MVNDFYQQARGNSPNSAFTPASASLGTTPGGDSYLPKFGDTSSPPASYGNTVQSITNGATFNGYTPVPYAGYSGTPIPEYQGYTQGPGYWGNTFFIWPPDPRPADDWRNTYFGVTDNTKLWDAGGNWRDPPGNYTINYKAILNWIKTKGPNPFPPMLRAGRDPLLRPDPRLTSRPSAYDHTQLRIRRSPTRTSDSGRSTSTG